MFSAPPFGVERPAISNLPLVVVVQTNNRKHYFGKGMMPKTRLTPNIRLFNEKLQTALATRGVQNVPYDTIMDPVWCDLINDVSFSMWNDDSAVFYKNTGDGRKAINNAHDRRVALQRFLDRTLALKIPHLQTIKWKKNSPYGAPRALLFESTDSGRSSEYSGNSDANGGGSSDSSQSDSSQNNQDNTQGSSSDQSQQDGQSESSSGGDSSDESSGTDGTESDESGSNESDSSESEMSNEELAELPIPEREQYEVERFKPDPDNQQESEFDKWWRILAKLRAYCRTSAEQGLPIDDLDSYRPAIMGAAMIREGITADACADAATAHWSDDAREEMEIKRVCPTSIAPSPPDMHPATAYLIKLLRAGVPAMLHGGAGVGKTTLAREVANIYDLPFGMVSMTSGLSTTALTGSVNLQGFVTRPCIDTFSNGGVFLFDEMDAADPNLLLICNTMLANGEFQSPVTGERHYKHTNWFPIAAVNTLNGGNTAYTGRSRLDHATMDRWRMGRIRVDFNIDLGLEYALKELHKS
jgi:hypothetical protein